MSQVQRSRALQRFASDPDARILLISLKAGGVGLNLTAASYLFLLDPWSVLYLEEEEHDCMSGAGESVFLFDDDVSYIACL
jgi:hypothetical protein